MQHQAIKILVLLCALYLSYTAEAAGVTNRAATSFSMQDVIAQFMTAATADEAAQEAQQRRFAEILERFRRTYAVDPSQSLYRVVQENSDVQNLRLTVDNTSEAGDLKAMNFEIVRLDFDQQGTHVSIFVLLSRAGAQHVQPEAFIGIDRVVITKDGTATTVTGMDMVSIIAALYRKK